MMKKIHCMWVVLLLCVQQGSAQDVPTRSLNDKNQWNAELNDLLRKESEPQLYLFKPEKNISVNDLFNTRKSAWGLTAFDEMKHVRADGYDIIGMKHYTYQQYHHGVKVEGAEMKVHERDGKVESTNGLMVQFAGKSVNTTPAIPRLEALKAALRGKDVSRELLGLSGKELDSYLEKNVELLLTRIDPMQPVTATNLVCAYAVICNGERVYVDAVHNQVIRSTSLKKQCHSGSCVTLYNGTKTFYTKKFTGIINDYYETIFDCNGANLHTHDGQAAWSWNDDEEIEDADNSWSAVSERPITTAHWAGSWAWDYYRDVHGRYGMNNGNGRVDIYANTSTGSSVPGTFFAKAGWVGNNNDLIVVVNGTAYSNNNAALDVIGHEFTHGVIAYTAGLSSSGESGALEEGYCDIFGNMIEFLAEPSTSVYEVGEQPATSDYFKRSLVNPKAYATLDQPGSPDCYNSPSYWDPGNMPHTNGGPLRRWFYLLAEGDASTNDLGQYYTVSGITRDKAADIAYRTMTVYLTSGSTYLDARNYSIRAAEDLFGTCSNEAIQTANAWFAVGVGTSLFYNRNACGVFSGTNLVGAKNLIMAGYTCSTTISAGSNTVFRAGNTVLLGNGFHAESGSIFNAYISECGATAYFKTGRKYPTAQDIINRNNTTAGGNAPENERVDKVMMPVIETYPNPARESFFIRFGQEAQGKHVTLRIFDMLGKLVAEQNMFVEAKPTEVRSEGWAHGIYLVKLYDGEKEIHTSKVTKID